MLAAEFHEFEALMRQAEKIFGKKIDDETMQVYWRALRDIPLATIKHRCDSYLKRAKFFPKPSELRPKDTTPVSEPDERSRREFDAAVARNQAFWDDELRRDELGTKWKLLDAYLARISVQEHPGSLIFAEKFKFAQEVCRGLIAQTGLEPVACNPHLMHTVSRLIGGQMLKQCVDLNYDLRRRKSAA